jgi:predicted membrane protein
MKFALLVLMALLIAAIILDFYYYPFCEKCRDNRRTKRINGKKFCEIHGDL